MDKVYYHGSNNKFTTFDKSKIKENKLGLCFNFTDDYNMAYQYGDNILKVRLDLNNPITMETLKSKWTYEQDNMLAKKLGFPDVKEEDFDDTETFGDIYNVFKMDPRFIEVLEEMGYDGISFPEDHHYGVFEPEQIHIIQDESINERLEELTEDIFSTKSGYDILNWMKNKPKPYRIVYDTNINQYFIGDAYNCIHLDITEEAYNSGFYPEMLSVHDVDDYTRNCMDNGTMLFFAFYPDEKSGQDADKSSDGYTRKYVYDFGIIYAHEMTPLEDFEIYKLLGEPISKKDVFESIDFKKLNETLLKYLN